MAGTAFAEEAKPYSAAISAGLYSNYIWRGQKLSKGFVVEPSITGTYYNFSANLWANYDMHTKKHTETDFTLSYKLDIQKLSITPGWIYYALDGIPDTQEFFLSVAYDVILQPKLTWYYDYKAGHGSYIQLSLGHTFKLPDGFAINLGASAAYAVNNLVLGTTSDGGKLSCFYNGEVAVTATVPVWKAISLEPKLAYSFPLSNDAKRVFNDIIDGAGYSGTANVVYGGIAVNINF